MKRGIQLVILTLAALLVMGGVALAKPSAEEREVLRLLNAKRVEVGAQPLKWGYRLESAADRHSKDMIKNKYFAHTSPTGRSLNKRLRSSGLVGWKRAAENIAGAGSARAAFHLWLGSGSHRRNMLKPNFTHVGIGFVRGGPYGSMFTMNLVQDPVASQTNRKISAEAREILRRLNNKRREVGVAPLKWGYRIQSAARSHSGDMLKRGYFAHTSPSGVRLDDRLRSKGITGWKRAGENLAGTLSAERAFGLWMKSDPHRHNMLKPDYTHVGIGIVRSGPSWAMYTMDLVESPRVAKSSAKARIMSYIPSQAKPTPLVSTVN